MPNSFFSGDIWPNWNAGPRANDQSTDPFECLQCFQRMSFIDLLIFRCSVITQYDKSGRSTGIAYVTYETQDEAVRAKKTFDGKIAKGIFESTLMVFLSRDSSDAPCFFSGEKMSISFDTRRPRPPNAGRSVSAPVSLMDRIQKPPLLQRLAGDAPGLEISKTYA